MHIHCCLYDLACFFLFLSTSLINMYIYVHVHNVHVKSVVHVLHNQPMVQSHTYIHVHDIHDIHDIATM